MARVNAETIREALQQAELSAGMTERIARACHCSSATLYQNLKLQNTSVTRLLVEERRRRLQQWLDTQGTLVTLAPLLGFACKKAAANFLVRQTGLTYTQWKRSWNNEQ